MRSYENARLGKADRTTVRRLSGARHGSVSRVTHMSSEYVNSPPHGKQVRHDPYDTDEWRQLLAEGWGETLDDADGVPLNMDQLAEVYGRLRESGAK